MGSFVMEFSSFGLSITMGSCCKLNQPNSVSVKSKHLYSGEVTDTVMLGYKHRNILNPSTWQKPGDSLNYRLSGRVHATDPKLLYLTSKAL